MIRDMEAPLPDISKARLGQNDILSSAAMTGWSA